MCCDTRFGAQHLADGAVLRASARSMAEKCAKRVVLAPARRQVQFPAPEACSMKTPGRRVGLCSDQRQASSNVLPVHIRSADAVQVTSPAAPIQSATPRRSRTCRTSTRRNTSAPHHHSACTALRLHADRLGFGRTGTISQVRYATRSSSFSPPREGFGLKKSPHVR